MKEQPKTPNVWCRWCGKYVKVSWLGIPVCEHSNEILDDMDYDDDIHDCGPGDR